ncbi:MAG: amidohydrolase family protein [Candidatus Hodarchaeaceae archaeon]|nr:amidohydrolase family protein [Candidatus Hodarchaeaceae archaeon]
MAKQTFYNAVVLEGEDLETVHGYLTVRDGIIEEIGEGMPSTHAVDLKHGYVLPPFVNAHTHLADSVAKEMYLGKTQPEVVGPGGLKFRELGSRTEKEIIAAIRSTLRDMLRTGTLAHCDFREGGVAGVKLLRAASSPPVISIILGRPSVPAELSDLLRVSDGVGLPSLDAFEPTVLRDIVDRTLATNKILAVHVAEMAEAQRASIRDKGKGEIQRALELRPSFVVHATWATEDDFMALHRADVPVVFCPRANSVLSVGTPPLRLALDAGTKFCLGTDNVTACQPNMFDELAFAWACIRRDSSEVGSEEARGLLRAATIEPLALFDLPWGPIQEGGRATFLVLSRRHNLTNLTDVHAGLVNRARADNIRAIYMDGKIL